MRQVVIDEQVDEGEVHPPGLYERFVAICVDTAQALLEQPEQFWETACPGCTSEQRTQAFVKHRYTYWSCSHCATLYVSPRPSQTQMDRYLLDSPVSAFRSRPDYLEGVLRRSAEVAYHRADWIAGLYSRAATAAERGVVDLEPRSLVYPRELQRRELGPLFLVKPLTSLTDLPVGEGKGDGSPPALTVLGEITQAPHGAAAVVTAFDTLEHHAAPVQFAQAAYDALGPGGLLAITTRSGSGFDIQTLWEHATVFPVEHLNLLSIEGMRALLARTGFQIVEISTPGQLDVQMVERVARDQPDVALPRFLRYFLNYRDDHARHNLQQFLQANLISSHLRVVARKIPTVDTYERVRL